MSKVSQADLPLYAGSVVNVGNSSATSTYRNNTLSTNYNMSDSEAAIYNYALDTIASVLPNINTFDSKTQDSLQESVNAYRDSGFNNINNYYNNYVNNLKNDIVSRFGNLDNSAFANNFNSIEQNRANAISSFAKDVLARQNELKSNELTSRYKMINLLNGLSNNIYGNALDAMNLSMKGSANANAYNYNAYKASIDGANADSQNLANIMKVVGTVLAVAAAL